MPNTDKVLHPTLAGWVGLQRLNFLMASLPFLHALVGRGGDGGSKGEEGSTFMVCVRGGSCEILPNQQGWDAKMKSHYGNILLAH